MTLLHKLAFLSLCAIWWATCNANTTSDTIENYLSTVRNTHEIPGLAVAVIKGDDIIHESYHGVANLEHQVPVSVKSLFRLYSATKLFTAVAVYQLIEQGKLTTETKLSEIFPSTPIAWRNIRIKHLLAHSSGIAELSYKAEELNELTNVALFDQLSQLPMQYKTGDHFRYTQSNYWLLAFIIETLSKQSFESFVFEHQLPFAPNALFSSNSLLAIPNRVDKYEWQPSLKQYQRTTYNNGVKAHAGNGLAISLSDMSKWAEQLSQQKLLTEHSLSQMWQPFQFNNHDKFLHGWQNYPVNGYESYGFTGGSVSGFRYFPEQDMSIIYLSNGFKFLPMHNMVINHIAGLVEPALRDQNALAQEQLLTQFLSHSFEEALSYYNQTKKQHGKLSFESTLNTLGYIFVSSGNLEHAIEVFNLNVNENPTSWNAHDSLASALEADKAHKKALQHYKRALALNVDNTYGYNDTLKEKITQLSELLPQ